MIIASPHYWPAEWEPQAATWISWPHNRDTWPDRFENIPDHFCKFALTLADTQPVNVLAVDEVLQDQHRSILATKPNIRIVPIPTNDVWIRDYGPTFVRRNDDHSEVGVCWKYNAWGGKYPPYDRDAVVAATICQELQCQRSVSSLYCEGGALETNGAGTLLTTSSCLLNPNRNPGWTRQMVEAELRQQVGVEKIIWVDGGGIEGDDTDGHIDQLARFVNANEVVAATSSTEHDPNFRYLEQNVRILERSHSAEGEPLKIHRLPTPPPRFVGDARVPESYCNFLIANKVVIVPTFRNLRTDNYAVELISSFFPSRAVIPLDAYDISWGLGAFHCASQQQPARKPKPPHRV